MDGTVDDKSGEGTTDAGAGDAVAVRVGLAEGSGAADGGGVGGAVGVGARLGRGVGGRVGTGVGGLVDVEMTVTTPNIFSRWTSQKYGKVPTLAKVVVNESPGASKPALAG